MVQPVSPTAANGRPECTAGRPAPRPVSSGKYEEFRAYLRQLAERAAGQPGMVPKSESESPKACQLIREIATERESPPSLAPTEQPSLGAGGAGLAELLALINPGSGLDPLTTLAPVVVPPASTHPGVAEVAELVERWVRRVAMGGDQRRGAVRLDIGNGRFSGAELLVVAEAGRVSVELQLPSGMLDGDLSQRLQARLEQRGYAADVQVR